MEKKILLQELSDILAEREGLTRKKAEAFVKAFFDVVEEALEADKFVKIKGFGTFKLVAVGERESINVNTGERIQIGGHSKISFTPDAFLRDLINRPFAHFQTVVLNEETEMEELDRVDRMMEELARKEAEENRSEEDVAALSAPETPEQPADTDIPELPPLPPLPDSAVPPPLPFESQKDEAGSDEPEEESGLAIPPIPADEEVEAPDEAEAESASATSSDVEDVPANDEADDVPAATGESTDAPIENEEELSETAPAEGETEQEPQETEVSETEQEAEGDEALEQAEEANDADEPIGRGERKRRRRFLAALAVVVLLMAASYFAGYFRLLCPCDWFTAAEEPQPVVPQQPLKRPAAVPVRSDSVRTDTATLADTVSAEKEPASQPEQTEEPEEKAVPRPQKGSSQEAKPLPREATPRPRLRETRRGSYVITGTRETHTVRRGETLRSIALRVYGSKSFARYIIQYNNIDNPDNIAVGTVIRLPELRLSTGDTTRNEN